MEWVYAAFRAVGEIFGFINKKTELNNTPEMQAREAARKENEAKDREAKIVKEGDDDEIRNGLS